MTLWQTLIRVTPFDDLERLYDQVINCVGVRVVCVECA
jgi:hypothetical protein